MATHHEIRHDRLYLKEPRTERLRKGAQGHLRRMLGAGWRETERWHAEDYITVRLERSGVVPLMKSFPKPEPPPPRPPRQQFGRGPGGGPGGPRR